MEAEESGRSSKWLPDATGVTAFASGASLAAIARTLDILKSHGVIRYDADSPPLFAVMAAHFLLTTFVFVIGLRNFFPRELRTRMPFVYFPTDRSGWNVLLHVWGRMLLWFIGAVTAIFLFALVPSGSQK